MILKDFFGLFRLNSIFFAFLANSPQPLGQFQTHPRARSSGHLHRSTEIGYHIPVLVSSAKMQESEVRSPESEGRHKAAAVRGSPAKAAPAGQAPTPFLPPTPSPLHPPPVTSYPFSQLPTSSRAARQRSDVPHGFAHYRPEPSCTCCTRLVTPES